MISIKSIIILTIWWGSAILQAIYLTWLRSKLEENYKTLDYVGNFIILLGVSVMFGPVALFFAYMFWGGLLPNKKTKKNGYNISTIGF